MRLALAGNMAGSRSRKLECKDTFFRALSSALQQRIAILITNQTQKELGKRKLKSTKQIFRVTELKYEGIESFNKISKSLWSRLSS